MLPNNKNGHNHLSISDYSLFSNITIFSGGRFEKNLWRRSREKNPDLRAIKRYNLRYIQCRWKILCRAR
jgi:hypothetical protein